MIRNRLFNYASGLLLVGVLVVTSPAGAAGAPLDSALGPAGEVFTALQGTCAELLESCAPGQKKTLRLAIEIARPGEDDVRLTVPGSVGVEVQGTPSLVYEDLTGTLLVIWESLEAEGGSRLNLARLQQETWSVPIEISQATETVKGTPAIALTRDVVSVLDDEGEPYEIERTVLHVAWWEEDETGGAVFYSPLFFLDGAFQTPSSVFRLSDFDLNEPASDPVSLPAGLVEQPLLVHGQDTNTLIAFFARPETGRVLAFELRVLPGELDALARSVAAEIDAQADLLAAGDLSALADRVGMHLIEIGARFHPGITGYLAAEIEAEILAAGEGAPGSSSELADRVGMHLIEIGARALGAGSLFRPTTAPVEALLVTELGEEAVSELPPGLDRQTVRLRLVTDRPAPEITGALYSIFLSKDAGKIIVAWLEEGDLLYRESSGPLWTAPRRLEIGKQLGLERASEILRQRVRED